MKLLCQHCTFTDSARAERERKLIDELGFDGVRSEFDPYELMYVHPEEGPIIGTFGHKILSNAFTNWGGLEVVLTLRWSPRLLDEQNIAINTLLVIYAYMHGVRRFILENEPEEWSRFLLDPAKRAIVARKVKALLKIVHLHAPESVCYCPALHGWFDGGAGENAKHLARWEYLWRNEEWVRSLGFATNLYYDRGAPSTKVKLLRPACVSELNRRPPGFVTRAELQAVEKLPIDFVSVYCLSDHEGYELMAKDGRRHEARIRALRG